MTANLDPKTVAEAVNVRPAAYLTKPFQPVTLVATIHAAVRNFYEKEQASPSAESAGDDNFFVKQGLKYKKLQWNKIVYLRSEDNYVVIYNAADDTEYYIRSTLQKTLNHIIPAFLQSSFLQVNRAEAVNFNFVKETTADEVKAGHKMFLVTKTYRANLRSAMRVHE